MVIVLCLDSKPPGFLCCPMAETHQLWCISSLGKCSWRSCDGDWVPTLLLVCICMVDEKTCCASWPDPSFNILMLSCQRAVYAWCDNALMLGGGQSTAFKPIS